VQRHIQPAALAGGGGVPTFRIEHWLRTERTMIAIRRAQERGVTRTGWLDSRHSFSFGQYRDPKHMGFGPLRVINDDRVTPGAGFPRHPHDNMEIVTYVLEGALAHKDSLGAGSVIRAGEVQRMSAGAGIEHSEFNHSQTEPVHFLQIWIKPEAYDIRPSYEQKSFEPSGESGFMLIASRDGRDGSVTVHQDVALSLGRVRKGEEISRGLGAGRRAWLQVTRGAVTLGGERLEAGDGAALEDEAQIAIKAEEDAEVLLFDMCG
jgi:redox-sensitive bicupin YhaK (pirin superfamily)